MLSLDHPEIIDRLKDAGPGIWPLKRRDNGKYVIVAKGSADFALAAKICKKLTFHVYDLSDADHSNIGIITAIYDRSTAPAIMRTVCDEPLMRDIISALRQDSISISFFDSYNSEIYGGAWSLSSGEFPQFIDKPITLANGDRKYLSLYIEIDRRFSAGDDGFSIEANLVKSEQVENLRILHMTDIEVNSARGEGTGLYVSRLTAEENIGSLHEAEIARLLARGFPPSTIYVGPKTDKGTEFCDVMVLGKVEAFCIQAKSGIRDENRAQESPERRRARNAKNFKKALKQVAGCERAFYKQGRSVLFKDQKIPISPEKTALLHLIVIPEKHPDDLEDWSTEVKKLIEKDVFVIVLDNAEFGNMATIFHDRDGFAQIVLTVHEAFIKSGKVGEYTFHSTGLASRG